MPCITHPCDVVVDTPSVNQTVIFVPTPPGQFTFSDPDADTFVNLLVWIAAIKYVADSSDTILGLGSGQEFPTWLTSQLINEQVILGVRNANLQVTIDESGFSSGKAVEFIRIGVRIGDGQNPNIDTEFCYTPSTFITPGAFAVFVDTNDDLIIASNLNDINGSSTIIINTGIVAGRPGFNVLNDLILYGVRDSGGMQDVFSINRAGGDKTLVRNLGGLAEDGFALGSKDGRVGTTSTNGVQTFDLVGGGNVTAYETINGTRTGMEITQTGGTEDIYYTSGALVHKGQNGSSVASKDAGHGNIDDGYIFHDATNNEVILVANGFLVVMDDALTTIAIDVLLTATIAAPQCVGYDDASRVAYVFGDDIANASAKTLFEVSRDGLTITAIFDATASAFTVKQNSQGVHAFLVISDGCVASIPSQISQEGGNGIVFFEESVGLRWFTLDDPTTVTTITGTPTTGIAANSVFYDFTNDRVYYVRAGSLRYIKRTGGTEITIGVVTGTHTGHDITRREVFVVDDSDGGVDVYNIDTGALVLSAFTGETSKSQQAIEYDPTTDDFWLGDNTDATDEMRIGDRPDATGIVVAFNLDSQGGASCDDFAISGINREIFRARGASIVRHDAIDTTGTDTSIKTGLLGAGAVAIIFNHEDSLVYYSEQVGAGAAYNIRRFTRTGTSDTLLYAGASTNVISSISFITV